ncbi:MAG: glycosyltransferase family 9 protein [Planctomycetota bacterium]|jgi:ADP-heptose:LPS heptosyltransferase
MAKRDEKDRILLIRLSAIGDVIHALFGLAALRAARPDAHVGFLVEDRAASLLAGHPDVDSLHVFPRKAWQGGLLTAPGTVVGEVASFVAGLRRERYRVAVDLQANLKGGVLSRLSGAPRRIGLASGFGKEGNHRFQTEWVTLPEEPIHRVERVFALLRPLGVNGAAGTPRVPVTDEDRDLAGRLLSEQGLAAGGFALLHPGTSKFGEYKRWPAERFGELAQRLADRAGLPSVVTWGPGEEDLADRVVAASAGSALRAPPTDRFTSLAALGEVSGLFVAADTGALHLAALVGAPTVGLFGPKDPRTYAPWGRRTTVVYKGVDCSPCPTRTCPDPVCMTSITVDDVLTAVLALLAEPAAPRATSQSEVRDAP